MSDSASKSDVEDVLSSVRRLVSSDAPRKRRPDLPKGPGALVLTDAQRVERPVSRGQAARSLEDRIAELEVAISSRDDDYEPDGSEDQAQHTPDRIVYTRPPTGAEEAEARKNALQLSKLAVVAPEAEAPRNEAQPEAPEVTFRHTEPGQDHDDGPDIEDEAPMAEDVSAAPRDSAEVRPFHNPDDMIDRFEARMDGNEAPAPGPGHNGFSERLEPYVPDAAESAGARADSRDEADADDADKVEAETDDDTGREDVIDAEFEADLTDAVTRSVAAEVEQQPAAAIAPAPVETASEDEPASENAAPDAAPLTPDEETLRPVVAKLIREELQGELGERITRNVRKLVRREIMRAINAREFE